jgi:hypothetical protein
VHPLLHWKGNEYYTFWVCVCSLSYPACNARAPYCHLWSTPLYNIFPHYLINSTIFEKMLLITKCVFWFSLQLLSETFLILKWNEWGMIQICFGLHVKYPLFIPDFNETWILSTDFRKILKYEITWKSVQWEQSCSMLTDGRTDMPKLVVAFRNFAKVPKRGNVFLRFRGKSGRTNGPNINLYAYFLSFSFTTFTYIKLLVPFTGCDILCRVCRWFAPLDVKSNSNFPCAYRYKQLYQTLQI